MLAQLREAASNHTLWGMARSSRVICRFESSSSDRRDHSGVGAVGSAAVSKTAGRWFEPITPGSTGAGVTGLFG